MRRRFEVWVGPYRVWREGGRVKRPCVRVSGVRQPAYVPGG
jgi:hypothetical protein